MFTCNICGDEIREKDAESDGLCERCFGLQQAALSAVREMLVRRADEREALGECVDGILARHGLSEKEVLS